nr:hypothetical protein [Cytophagales bacterium]
MSEKDPSRKQDSSNEDEDFGLPKVKFTPIGPEKRAATDEAASHVGREERVKKTVVPKTSTTKEKKGNGFLLVLLFFIIAIGAGSLYYFGFFEATDGSEQSTSASSTLVEPVPPAPVIAEAEAEVAPTPEMPAENTLSEITGRAASPRYYVVVGSFIDGDLAKDYSNILNKAGNSTFLIHPYGDIAYYRLAVAQYDNVKQALEVMKDQQENFEENLWVLKY